MVGNCRRRPRLGLATDAVGAEALFILKSSLAASAGDDGTRVGPEADGALTGAALLSVAGPIENKSVPCSPFLSRYETRLKWMI